MLVTLLEVSSLHSWRSSLALSVQPLRVSIHVQFPCCYVICDEDSYFCALCRCCYRHGQMFPTIRCCLCQRHSLQLACLYGCLHGIWMCIFSRKDGCCLVPDFRFCCSWIGSLCCQYVYCKLLCFLYHCFKLDKIYIFLTFLQRFHWV